MNKKVKIAISVAVFILLLFVTDGAILWVVAIIGAIATISFVLYLLSEYGNKIWDGIKTFFTAILYLLIKALPFIALLAICLLCGWCKSCLRQLDYPPITLFN